ncbi:hypothetical protein FBU30_010061 [Linnemannia zychae]|nr:hypothetical protein FBU30_010061 [Linnemannia zychae]
MAIENLKSLKVLNISTKLSSKCTQKNIEKLRQMIDVFEALNKLLPRRMHKYFTDEKSVKSAFDTGYYRVGLHGKTTTGYEIRHVDGGIMSLQYVDWSNPEEIRIEYSGPSGDVKHTIEFDRDDWERLGGAIVQVTPAEVIEERKKKIEQLKARQKAQAERYTPNPAESALVDSW